MDALCAQGDEERVAMAVFSLGKAREKVKEKEEAIQQPDGSVRRMQGDRGGGGKGDRGGGGG